MKTYFAVLEYPEKGGTTTQTLLANNIKEAVEQLERMQAEYDNLEGSEIISIEENIYRR